MNRPITWVSTPEIKFTSGINDILPWNQVQAAVFFAEKVAKLNRNTAVGPLIMVTDDAAVVESVSPLSDTRVGCDEEKRWGSTFTSYDHTVIWLSPAILKMPNAKWQLVETFAHELAHAMTASHCKHNWTWRRMYTLILVMIGKIFAIEFNVAARCRDAVQRYQRQGTTERPVSGAPASYRTYIWADERRDEEVEKHLAAYHRMMDRLAKVGL